MTPDPQLKSHHSISPPQGEISTNPSDETRTDSRPKNPAGRVAFPFLGAPKAVGDLGSLGSYRVTGLLGQGGMGIVFLGEDEGLRRSAALKVMRPEFAAHSVARERFLREGRAAAAIKSDHVVVIYQVGEHDGLPFLAMEYLVGATLEDWLHARGNCGSAGDAIRIATDILRGLAAAHEKGQVHRDIKPVNLWVESPTGRVKVLDFGLTRGADDAVSLDGAVVGTPSYMAPEQADGHAVDPRADLFSFGTVLYRFLTGTNPFARESIPATLLAVKTFDPVPLASAAPGVPAALAHFVHRLLSKDPTRRPADARAALAELDAAQKQSAVSGTSALPLASSLIGREQLLASVLEQLRAGGIVLRGEGGMGKTALALAAAHRMRADGILVVWVKCEQAVCFEGCIRDAAMGLFGDRCEGEPVEPLSGRVAAQLAARAALLVFDSFEAVAANKALVRWVTRIATPAQLLITTRELPLGLPGRVISVQELARADAVRLFRERAAEAGLTGAPPTGDIDALCEQVGDQPLAIELLAVRAARTPVKRLLDRVRKSLAALDADVDHDRPVRHNGVRACFNDSFESLSPPARSLILAMSVLPAPFGPEVIGAVSGSDEWDEAADELVAASLWRLANDRYGVHPLVRQLARDQLGDQLAAAEKLAGERVTALARAKRGLLGAGSGSKPGKPSRPASHGGAHAASDRAKAKAYLDWCEAELPNLAALADAGRARGDGATVVGIAQSLSALWSARGYWDVGDRICQQALASSAAADDRAAEAWCMEYHGYICRHVGRFSESDEAYRAAVAICDAHPEADAAYRGRICARYGKLCSVLNRYDDATALLTTAIERFRLTGDEDGETMATIYLGQTCKFAGNLPRAEELFLHALGRARAANNTHREGETLYQLGNAYLRMNRIDEAERALQESLRLARLADDRVRESQGLVDLGVAAMQRGAWTDAERHMTAGLQLARNLGLRLHEGRTMRRLAELFVATGDPERAREYIRGAITVLAECEDEWAKSRSQETLNKVEATIANRPAKA